MGIVAGNPEETAMRPRGDGVMGKVGSNTQLAFRPSEVEARESLSSALG